MQWQKMSNIEGKIMFTNDDVETTKIDGVSYYTFQPNTIVYAVPVDSDMGNKVKKAKSVYWQQIFLPAGIQYLVL